MLSKLRSFVKEHNLITRGDRIVCAVSGGADSMALLWAMYLLKEEWELDLSAAHFNHRLRGEESDRDEQFVRDFCEGYGIPLYVGSAQVVAGEKGLEAAARDARYAYFSTLPGKIATAHTADDNAETLLMHRVRGTGLKGLGGIAPIRGNLVRPMLSLTREDVENFLDEYAVSYISDSSNGTDQFLRNRLRHHVMPLLKEENPRLAENLSAMALRLRLDEEALTELLLQSAETYEKYTAPLGLCWMLSPEGHYGPSPWGYEFMSWGTYNRADREQVGIDRTTAGTGLLAQYPPAFAAQFEDPAACPDGYLLFFHRLPYSFRMRDGRTLIQRIYDDHFEGYEEVLEMQEILSKLHLPERDRSLVEERMQRQLANAREWRDVVNTFFHRLSGIPDAKGRRIYE